MFVLSERKVFLLCLVIVVSILCRHVCGRATKGSKKELIEISLIHINDFHARFEPVSSSSGTCLAGQEESCFGGIARIATVVKRLVNERPNPVFLNAGDNFQGTLWYTKFKWNVTSQFMNMLPHDALVIISLHLLGVVTQLHQLPTYFLLSKLKQKIYMSCTSYTKI
jgi:2',3'-cyclic-nucleotide 2'-phosphodiesterase (5'-nucleotidase family)